jgi:hypothetical protein
VGKAAQDSPDCAFVGVRNGKMKIADLNDFPNLVDETYQRPKEQKWIELLDVFNDTSMAP